MYLQLRTQQKQECLAYNIDHHTDGRVSENRYFASKEHVLGQYDNIPLMHHLAQLGTVTSF